MKPQLARFRWEPDFTRGANSCFLFGRTSSTFLKQPFRMSDFMHCNSCYRQPLDPACPKYFLTSCYHILCQNCLQQQVAVHPILCSVCRNEMQVMEINSAMDSKLKDLFMPPKKLIEEKMAALKRKYDFHQTLVRSVLGHLKKQREKLDQLTKYCQQQTRLTKEREKELNDLKEWVTVAEMKMKENEQEKVCLLKEIEDMKKLSKRFGRDIGYESTIDKIFADTGNTYSSTFNQRTPTHNATTCQASLAFNGNFETDSDYHPSSSSFLQSSNVTISGELGSLASSCASPQSSVNNSLTSEMTTPKMLGLPKKGAGSSGGLLRKTPTGSDNVNPYAEVFNRASILQKRNNRALSSKPNVCAGSKQSMLRFPTKSPTMSGYVTHGTIIPRVNTPSSLG
ncbi:hypothetical protein KIN20_005422 [Parelaphostrongylus tenuis]|uniref:RING-type domain-containing protein n=1 Tax=Parelaphostrongylus tenuis TaxID=148309 RepID=A0AAD5M019_PARTN|nr:hypothetical protein KIN20_005422 [Parelaphostrongylus tenuis]